MSLKLTKAEVEILVKRAMGRPLKIIDFQVSTNRDEKIGFMGEHSYLSVEVEEEEKAHRRNFFIKSIPYKVEPQMEVIIDSKIFFKETQFYEVLLPQLTSSIKDDSWTAKCYYVREDTIIFEDLSKTFVIVKEKLLSSRYLRSALSSIAKMHAASILTEKRLGKSLSELYPEIVREQLFVRKGIIYGWFREGVRILTTLVKLFGFDESSVARVCERIFDLIAPSKSTLNVLCHGDPWSNNLMFNDSHQQLRCVLVDFQHIRYTSPMVDVLQVLYLNTRRAFREEVEEEMLRHYHETLCETLRDNDKEIDLPTFTDIYQDYQRLRLVGVVTAAFYFQLSLLDSKTCAEETKDSDSYKNLLFRDRSRVVKTALKRDPQYNARISEIVQEFDQRTKSFLAAQ